MTIRAPHLSPKRERRIQPALVVPNLLVTTLAVAFSQSDWPNPQSVETQQPVQLGMPLTILADAGDKPFLQTDWPNPLIEGQQEPDNRGSFLPLTVAPAKPFSQLDWPNPTVSILIQTPFQVGSSLTILEDAGDKPFVQYDWIRPGPAQTVQLEQIRTSIALITTVDDAIIGGIRLSMSANKILLREKTPNIRLTQIGQKIVFRD